MELLEFVLGLLRNRDWGASLGAKNWHRVALGSLPVWTLRGVSKGGRERFQWVRTALVIGKNSRTLGWPCLCSDNDFLRGIASDHAMDLGG